MRNLVTAMTERDRCERWFVRRSPSPDRRLHRHRRHLHSHGTVPRWRCLSRVFLAFGDRWTGWSQAVAFLGGIAALVGGVVLVNRIRGVARSMPDDIGVWELALYVVLPIVPTVIGSRGSAVDNAVSVVAFNLVLLAVGYVVTSWALIPMMRWSFGQVRRQVTDVANLAMKSLPTLLIFSAFIFINAEMWQVGTTSPCRCSAWSCCSWWGSAASSSSCRFGVSPSISPASRRGVMSVPDVRTRRSRRSSPPTMSRPRTLRRWCAEPNGTSICCCSSPRASRCCWCRS